MNSVELTTMCAVLNKTEDSVLCIDRINSWPGWAFPGGHLESNECFYQCAMREIEEETGIKLLPPTFKGIVNIFNTETLERHIIINYLAHCYTDEAIDRCSEGDITWVKRDDLNELSLAEGMGLRFQIFFEPGIKELYIEWDRTRGYTKVEIFDM